MKETVVVIDGGGRGSVLVHKYSKSPDVERILAVPGNDFMQVNSEKPVTTYPDLKTTSVQEIVKIAKKEGVSLVDVAQDNAVAAGLVDSLLHEGINVLGPTKQAGAIESSKAFSRELLQSLGVPQPEFAIFSSVPDGISYLKNHQDQQWFVKASGLAEGKGALAAKNNAEAIRRIRELQRFGDAANTYLLEQWLRGENGEPAEEFSAFAISDGNNYKIIGYAQDHKRVFDNEEGENTGGMGCVSPPRVISEDIQMQVDNIFSKTINGLQELGKPYTGVLYLGGMLVRKQGRQHVYVIEFNARWGDPEAQVLVPSIQNDFFELGDTLAKGDIDIFPIRIDDKTRVAVAGAAKGYPGDYSQVKGKIIYGLEEAMRVPDVTIYGAGIKQQGDKWLVNGGRVIYAVGEGNDVLEARERAYTALGKVNIEGNNLHYRKDIGWRDVRRLGASPDDEQSR